MLWPYVEPIKTGVKYLLWAGFTAMYGWLLWRFFKEPAETRYASLIRKITAALVLMIVFASSKFNVWYIGMFFPLIFLLPESCKLRRFGVLLSLVQLLAFSPVENIHIVNYLILTLAPFAWVYLRKRHDDPPLSLRGGGANGF